MKRNKTVQVLAFFALFGIIISIIGTGILVLTTPSHNEEEVLTQEKLQEMLKNNPELQIHTGAVEASTGKTTK